MAALSFDALLRALKHGDPDPVYYLHGEEDVLKDEAVRALVDRAVPPESRDFNLDTRSAAESGRRSVARAAQHAADARERRAVVLRGVEQLRKKSKPRDALLAYLEHPSPDTLLVLVQTDAEDPEADLAARATAVVMERLPPERAVRWVAHAAGARGLSDRAGGGRAARRDGRGRISARLRQELDKLAVLVVGRAGGSGRRHDARGGPARGDAAGSGRRCDVTRRRRAPPASWSRCWPRRGCPGFAS